MTHDAIQLAPEAGAHTLIRLPSVIARTGLSRSTLYRLVSAGEFPRPIKLGERCSAWNSREIDAWIADRIAKRDQDGKP
ncbi:MAG: AlpA family transcriptional regulator [Xanthomonadaceae bacterium]|nr:AlpA family transcriptional regulator [Xanthomonadaceae bacterium]